MELDGGTAGVGFGGVGCIRTLDKVVASILLVHNVVPISVYVYVLYIYTFHFITL